MNKLGKIKITVRPVKQKEDLFKKETYSFDCFEISTDRILLTYDDTTGDTYIRIKNSNRWRIDGLKGYEFEIDIHAAMKF